MRTISLLLIMTVMTSGSGCKQTEPPATATSQAIIQQISHLPPETPEQAMAEIEKLGGWFIREGGKPDGSVVEVVLSNAGSEGAAKAMEHLKGFNTLKRLDLTCSFMPDAGMVHLKGLTQVRALILGYTMLTDAGLENLKGLPQLQELNLTGTQVTDAGLKHLRRLTQLKKLYLFDCPGVTDRGVKSLQELLPNCKMEY